MNYLTVDKVAKAYGERVLFEDITFYVNQGDRIALVAKNGTGKTSLLNLIIGKESADGGIIEIHPKVRMEYLPQEPNLDEQLTVFEAVYDSDSPIMKAVAEYERCLKNPNDQTAMQRAMTAMDRLNAWDYEVKVKQILTKLEVAFFDRPIQALSGGQRKRVALAKVLIDEPDFVIMDEPTNHLDLDMIEWLEDFLKTNNITLFMVTHDRYFLDAVCNQILELDNGSIYKYQGDYADYLIRKAEREASQQASLEKAKNLYTKELDWMRRQPQARTTKAKSRIDRFFDIEKKAKTRLDEDTLQLDLKMNRLGSKILEAHNISKTYGDLVLLKNFDYKFAKKDRVGIIGRNGTGKTTLLNILTKKIQPDTGKVVHGDTLEIGYYTQSGLKLPDDKRVIDIIRDIAEFVPMHGGKKLTAGQLLERFLFDYAKQRTVVSKLSGGEKRRLHLLTILMKNPNFLILDEPTNDLDIVTLQVLEDFLMHYPGCVLIVSHDRHFMDKIVEHVFVLEGEGRWRDFPGNYSQYRARQHEFVAESETTSAATTVDKKSQKSSKEIHEAKKEVRKVEKQIEQLQKKKAKITARFSTESLTPDQITDLSKELSELDDAIEEKEMVWMELMEELE